MSASSLARVGREIRPAVVLIGGLSIAINLLLLVPSLYMMQIYDRVLRSGVVETLIYITLIAATAIAAYAALEAIRLKALARIGEWIEDTLFEPLFSASVGVERGMLKGAHLGDGTPLSDLRTVRAFLAGPTLPAICDTPWMPIFLIISTMIHPYLGLLGLGFSVLIIALAVLNDVITRPASEQIAKGAQDAQRVLTEAGRNIDTVSAMGLGRPLAARAGEANARSMSLLSRATDRGAGIVGVGKFLRVVAQIATLGLGAWLSLGGHITPGGMIASSILLGRALAPLDQAIAAWRGQQQARAAWKRIRALLSASQNLVEGSVTLPKPAGWITVEEATLVAADKPIVSAVSFAIKPGESLAVIGPSGSGKSSLCRLLVGARAPSRGVVRLDGGDIMLWREDQRRAHVGFLAQGTELFSGRVNDVIARFGKPNDDAVVAAARLAGCHELILGLPEGYETMLTNGGAFLSGGQRQRIALARAVYGDTQFVVLDEPNANLDGEGERAFVACLATLKQRGVTVILVTHKPAIANLCDLVGLMRDGQLVRLGPPTQVMRELLTPVPSDVRTMAGAA